MNIQGYLDRIGFKGDLRPDLTTLRALHNAHLEAIPFEDLDVQLGRPVSIEPPKIYEKIVGRRRGGWCYEMNGLFGWVLSEIGFRVTRATGAVRRDQMGDFVVGNHLVLRVDLNKDTYLADVGFGSGPHDPVRIVPGEFRSHGFGFLLERQTDRWWRLRNHPDDGSASFDFLLDAADETVLQEKCTFLQTSPQSPFVQNAVCQRQTKGGVTILRGRMLRHVTGEGVKDERPLESADDFLSVLAEEFDLDIPGAERLWPKIVARHEEVLAAAAGEARRSAG